jgi:Cu(I)/Ag(I) efflux system membrane fusion protein
MKKGYAVAGLFVAAAALVGAGYYLGRVLPSTRADSAAPDAPQAPRKVLYWHDPMTPGPRFDKPGKSPFMDMQLVPVYADGDANSAGVQVTSQVQQNLGIRWASVRRVEAASSFDAVGTVQFDERRSVAVQTRVSGFIEHLAVRAPLERVRKGQALATVFAPDWLGPQNEWLALKRAGVSPDILAAAAERMRVMSIPESLIRQAEDTGIAQARFTLTAPISGFMAELGVREGVSVAPGATLFRIAGLDKVWVTAEVPEAQVPQLTRGQKVKAVLQADATQTFAGELQEILPQINATTRTLQARFEVDNAAAKLVPGMLVRLEVAGPKSTGLVLPSEAVIRTGRRAVVIVRKDSGAFEPREVMLGRDLGDEIEVLQGLNERDQVVASGQFLMDSEAHLRSALGGLSPPAALPPIPAPGASAPAGAIHEATGTVESVTQDRLMISHGPVAELNWPAMTMGFSKPTATAFAGIVPGDTFHFQFKKGGAAGYELVAVHKSPPGAAK